jgi:archaellum component FlaC
MYIVNIDRCPSLVRQDPPDDVLDTNSRVSVMVTDTPLNMTDVRDDIQDAKAQQYVKLATPDVVVTDMEVQAALDRVNAVSVEYHVESSKVPAWFAPAMAAALEPILNTIHNSSTRIDNIITKIDTISTKLDHISAKVDNISTKVDNISTKVDTISIKLDNIATKVDNISTNVDNIATKVDNSTATRTNLSTNRGLRRRKKRKHHK